MVASTRWGSSGPRRLLLLRHAQAQALQGSHDHARTLSPFGQDQAHEVGEDLAARGLFPDFVLCSTAQRTQQTLAQLLRGLAAPQPELELCSGLYASSVAATLEQIALVDSRYRTLLVVGHEPTQSELARALSDPQSSDPQALAELNRGLSTAALATIELPDQVMWAELGPGFGCLVQVGGPGRR